MSTQEQENTEVEVTLESEGQNDPIPTDEQKSISEEGKAPESDNQDDGNEVEVVIAGEEPKNDEEQKAPGWVKELRKTYQEEKRKNKELEAKIQAMTAEPKPAALGQKPTLEGCDYDAEKFEAELDEWFNRKRQAEAEEAKAQADREAQDKEWKQKLDHYGELKAAIRVKDFDEAEAGAMELLSEVQRGIILDGADNPAMVIYALGKNPAKAKELAETKSLSRFTFLVAKLEDKLSIKERKAIPTPEKTVSAGTARISGTVDSTLEALRAAAEKSGDYTKVTQYKRLKGIK